MCQEDSTFGAEPQHLDRLISLGLDGGDDNLTGPPGPQVEGLGGQVGRYKLLQVLGEGGMGVVYLAEQTHPIRRQVALKIIKLGMDTKQVIARFEAERQALALMDHPNIARVLDAGATETGRPYFVMELVQGVPITEYCDRNNLNTKDRLELFIQICHAVQHAHQKGIIHRDLKPSNVQVALVDGKAVPKIIDFGIAKAMNQRLTEKTLFTRYGQIAGTPVYMSPEQAELNDLDVDTRSDIYSLGVLLYELLTGTTPFREEELRQAGYLEMQRVIREQVPAKPSTRLSTLGDTLTDIAQRRNCTPELLRKAIRGDLDWIVMKTLEKDRTRRYETANALSMDVQRHLDQEPIHAVAPSASYQLCKFVRRHRALVAGVLAILGVAIVALIVITMLYVEADRSHRQEAAARTEADRLRTQEATQRRNAEAERDKALQAEKLAEQRRNEAIAAHDEADVIANFLKSATRLDLPASEISGMDLEHLAGSRSLRSLAVPETKIKDADLVCLRDVLSLEGLFLGKTQVTDAGLANLKDMTQLQALCVHDTAVGDAGLAFLRDLRSLRYLCLARTKVTDAGLVHLRGLDSLQVLRLEGTQVTETGTTELSRLLPNCRVFGPPISPVPSPTQSLPATLPASARRLVAVGKRASWSPDGGRIVFGKPHGGLKLLDLNSNKTAELVGAGKDPTWSPDGRLIAYVQGPSSDGSVSEEVWLVTPTGESPRKLVNGGFPTWSADGKTLYVHSRKEAGMLAITIDNPGAEPAVVLDKPGSWYPAISPDGTCIALGPPGALVIVDRQSQKPVLTWPTPESRGLLPAWSPDGRQVAFGGFDGDPLGVWVLDVEAKTAVQVAPGRYTMPAWSPDGKRLAFDLRSNGVHEIWVIQSAEIQGPKLTAAEAAKLRIAVAARPTGPAYVPRQAASLKGKPLPHLKDLGIDLPVAAKDKMLLVCFWDMDQRPSRHCLTQLAAQAGSLAARGVLVVAVHAARVKDGVLGPWLEQNKIPFVGGTIAGDIEETKSAWGVNSLPHLILTGKNHVVVAEGFGIDELDKQIETAGQ